MLPIALWPGSELLGSGDALESSTIAQTPPPGSASSTLSPTLTVSGRALDTLIAPALLLVALAIAVAFRERRQEVLVLALPVAAWSIEVVIFAELGYTGRRRNLVAAAGVASLLAGAGLAEGLHRIEP